MNIQNTILTRDGLKKISSLKETDDIKFFYQLDFPDYDYWEMNGNLQHTFPSLYKMNGIDFFEKDIIRAKVNDGNPQDYWVFDLFEKFQNENKIYFLSFDDIPTEILTFEYVEIENINKQPKHIHFYFEDAGYVSYSEIGVLVKVNSYYRAN